MPPATLARPRVLIALVLAALAALALAGPWIAARTVTGQIHRRAAARGLTASWRTLRVGFPLDVELVDLTVARAAGDTTFRAESLAVAMNPWSLLALHPRMSSVTLSHATIWTRASGGSDPDTLAPDEPRDRGRSETERAERLRRSAERLVDVLLTPARGLPHLALRDVRIRMPARDEALLGGATLSWLELRPVASGMQLAANGDLEFERPAPFELALAYGNDDRITGGVRFMIPPTNSSRPEPLRIALDGRLAQHRGPGRLVLADSSRVAIGQIPFLLSGSLERRGPRVRFALHAERITPAQIVESLPAALLGPLLDLSVRGEFGYRLGLDLDAMQPDSVEFEADVLPRGLRLDPSRTRLKLFGLEQPFTAVIHLPRGVIVTRQLSPANSRYRTLEAIDSVLVHAVMTNEDGNFYRHRGFNTEAVKLAIAANLKAGAFRRGAGTITMQLARNLYLGHERTLSRKAHEVVLAWVLEHLTGVSKRRLLEIYFNIIEWGPGVHGADEAAQYYFGRDAGRLSVDEALFLSTVVPAPRKWRYRFGPNGELKSFARAQMHFIGRKMVAKGWLSPEALPAADLLRVEIRGPARDVLFPPEPGEGTLAIDSIRRR